MRVIAGTFRSRQLKTLKGNALRPTSDRLRETLFNVLADRVPDSRFLDLFAGTGAVGIEALSRGARESVFIENHAPAAVLIRKNLASLQIQAGARVLPLDVLRGLEKLAAEPASATTSFDLIYLDPPYAADIEYERALEALGESPLVAPEGRVIVEHLRKRELAERAGDVELARVVEQGDAALSFYRLALAA